MADESATPVTPSLEQSVAPKARTRAGAWIGVIATALIGTFLIAAADAVPQPDADHNRAEVFLPSDGDAHLVEYDDGSAWVTESAFSIGHNAVTELPPSAFVDQNRAITNKGLIAEHQRYWRQTWTDVTGNRGQISELYHLSESGVRLVTLTGGELGFSYQPGLLMLPTDVRNGSTWSSNGDALPDGELLFTSTGSAAAASDECLIITINVTYADPAARDVPLRETSEASTWCPGEGATGASFTVDGVPGSTTTTPLTSRVVEHSPPHEPDYSYAGNWRARARLFVLRDPVFGGMQLIGASGTLGIQTQSGILAFSRGTDVLGYARDENGLIAREWVAHPGGTILSITAVGDSIIAATSNRQLVLYDVAGARAWETTFTDIIDAPPVPDGQGGLVALSLAGELRRLSLEDGTSMWTTDLSSDSAVAPSVIGDRVLTLDRDGTARAFDLGTGMELWSINFDGGQRVVSDGTAAFLVGFWNVSRVHPATGEILWTSTFDHSIVDVVSLAEGIVVVTSDGTLRLDRDGNEIWRRPAATHALSGASTVALLYADELEVIDSAGTSLVTFSIPELEVGSARNIIGGVDRLWLATSGYGLLEVGP